MQRYKCPALAATYHRPCWWQWGPLGLLVAGSTLMGEQEEPLCVTGWPALTLSWEPQCGEPIWAPRQCRGRTRVTLGEKRGEGGGWFEMIEKEEWLCCVCLNRVRNGESGNRDTGRKFLRIASFLYSKLGYLLASKDFIRKPRLETENRQWLWHY